MRRVAVLSPAYFAPGSLIGGGERYPLNLAIGVALAGGGDWEVTMLSLGSRREVHSITDGVRLVVLPGARGTGLDGFSWSIPEMLRGHDIVHIHQIFTRCAEVGLLSACLIGIPSVGTDHGGDMSEVGKASGFMNLFSRIVSNSAFGASVLPSGAEVTVIRGGVDTAAFVPAGTRDPDPHFLYVGRIMPHKGIDRVVRALPARARLTICGRPHDKRYLRELRGLAIGRDVTFVHDASDSTIRDLYRRVTATVLPSVDRDMYGRFHPRPELMGFTLLESMACGTPVICSSVGGMPEYVIHGETGYVVDSDRALSATLLRAAWDRIEIERMGRAARCMVVDRFDLRSVGAQLIDVYESLLSGIESL